MKQNTANILAWLAFGLAVVQSIILLIVLGMWVWSVVAI
jgi:hypothetical protein